MIPIHWSSSVAIPNARELVDLVERHGGRIVEYQRVFSLVVYSQSTPEYVWVRPGESRFRAGLESCIITCAFGWWSLPGLIWTPAALLFNATGGADVTRLVQLTTPPGPPPPPPRTTTPPPLPTAARGTAKPPPLPPATVTGFSPADEEALVASLRARDRFGTYKLMTGIALAVSLFLLGYLWSRK